MGSEEERRCESIRPDVDFRVRCDLWGGHGQKRHYGFDSDGFAHSWDVTFGEVRRPVEEDRRLGEHPADSGEWDRWVSPLAARRIGELERQVELVARQRDEGTAGLARERDEARRELRAVRDQMSAEDRERIQMGQQLREWKDRCLEAERVRDAHYRSWMNVVRQRNEAQERIRELEQEPCEALRECERYANMVVGERDELQVELERWKARTRELNVAADRLSEKAREDLASSNTQVHELQLQVATQADMIRTQREELRNLRAGAEA